MASIHPKAEVAKVAKAVTEEMPLVETVEMEAMVVMEFLRELAHLEVDPVPQLAGKRAQAELEALALPLERLAEMGTEGQPPQATLEILAAQGLFAQQSATETKKVLRP